MIPVEAPCGKTIGGICYYPVLHCPGCTYSHHWSDRKEKSMNAENLRRAINLGVCFAQPWEGEHGEKLIRCFDSRMGYGQFVDLTPEEYKLFQKVTTLTINEQLGRLAAELAR